MTLHKDIMPYFNKFIMFIIEIWVYCGPTWIIGHQKVFQLPTLGTQFLIPGYDPASWHFPLKSISKNQIAIDSFCFSKFP